MTTTSQVSPPSSTEIATVVAAVKSPTSVSSVIGTSLISVGGTAQPSVDASVGGWDGLGYPLTVTVHYNYQSLLLASVMQLLSSVALPNPIPLSTKTSVYLN